MTGHTDLDAVFDGLLAAAAEHDLIVFPNVPSLEVAPSAWWSEGGEEFVAVAARAGAVLLYLADVRLDAPAIEQLEDNLRAPGGTLDDGDLQTVAKARDRIGERTQVDTAFVVGGVIHYFTETADWWSQLESRESMTRSAERVLRREDQQRADRELEVLAARTEQLTEGLSEFRAFYSAVNDDERNTAAMEFDDQLRSLLDPTSRHKGAGWNARSLASAIMRSATQRVRIEVRPRLVEELRTRIAGLIAAYEHELGEAHTKDQKRRVARRAVEADLGFAAPALVDVVLAKAVASK
jgi:hypothetical protein